jgi:uncharacterized protein
MRAYRRCLALLAAAGVIWSASMAATAQPRSALPRHAVFGAAVAQASAGVSVTAVVPNSAAGDAGLRAGDVIVRFDGRSVSTVASYLAAVRASRSGTTVDVAVLRSGAPFSLSAHLRAAPDEQPVGARTTYESLTVDGTLRRTLVTVPDSVRGRLPAVLLVGGIGCYTVDDANDPSDGYARVMQDVARAGFLTMRLEKSGVGDSQGPPCHDVDFETESRSYALALDALLHDSRVDRAHVYLLGHSIGTAIVDRLSVSRPVAGVIASEAFARDWFEYEMANLRRQLELGGDPPDIVDAKLLSKAACMQHALYDKVPESQVEAADPDCKQRNGIYPVAMPYMQQVASLDIAAAWQRVSVPVLVVYGTSDYVVDPDDASRIVAIVNARHSRNATLAIVHGMTHPLHFAATPAIASSDFEHHVAEPYDTDFSTVVVDWLCNREHCTAPGAAYGWQVNPNDVPAAGSKG